MSPFLKNSISVLAIVGIAYAGYYLYTINRDSTLETDGAVSSVSEAELGAREFLDRLRELGKIELSQSLFEDPRFTSLQSNSFPIDSVPIGTKNNPFVQPR